MQKENDRELVKMWSNYCIMIRCVTGFFSYLDRCYVEQYKLPSLRGPVSMIQGNVLLPHFLLLCEDDCLPTSLSATSYVICPSARSFPTSMMKQELLFLLW